MHGHMLFPSERLTGAPSAELLDMARLFGGEPRPNIMLAEGGLRPGWSLLSEDLSINTWYPSGEGYTQIHVDGHDGERDQKLRWSAVNLYAQQCQSMLAAVGIVVEDPQQPPETEEDSLLLILDNKGELPLPKLLEAATEDVFAGEPGKLVLAGLVGARNWDAFVRTWDEAEQQITPLRAAQYLIASSDAF